MAYRWVISPVVTISRPDTDGGADDVFRAPKVSAHLEPGRGKYYQHSSAIDAGNWCLSLVKADDFTPLDADPECIHLLEANFINLNHIDLNQTPRDLGWTNARLTRIKNRAAARGINTTGLTLDTPLWQILQRICQAIAAFFDARRLRL